MTMLTQSPVAILTAPSTTLVNYTGIDSVVAWNATATNVGNKVGGGTHGIDFDTWTINTTNGPGASGSYLLELCTEDTAGTITTTGLQVSMPANSTGPYSSTGGPINIAQGANRCLVRSTPTGTPGTLGKMSWNQKRTSDNQVLMSGVTNATTTVVGTRYLSVLGGGQSGTLRNEFRPAPHALTIDNLFVELSADPGNGKKMVVTLLAISPSGGFYDGTVVTRTLLVATVTGNGSNGVTGSDTAHSASIAAGDLIAWELVLDAGSTVGKLFLGAGALPVTAGDTAVFYESFPTANSTTFSFPQVSSNATESNTQANVFTSSAKNFCSVQSGGASNFTDYANNQVGTISLMIGGSISLINTVTYTGVGGSSGAKQKTYAGGSDSLSDGNLIDLKTVMSGGGLSPSNSVGFTLATPQPATAGRIGAGFLQVPGLGRY